MKINSIGIFNRVPLIEKSNNSFRLHNLQADTVSFSSKYNNPVTATKNVQKASSVGQNIYKKLNNGIPQQQIFYDIRMKNPLLSIKPIEELAQYIPNAQDYQAYYTYHLGSDFEPDNTRLYINMKLPLNNKYSRLSFAMDAAHEYTHYQQTINGCDKKAMQDVSGNDARYAGFITAIGDKVFAPFDTNIQAEMVRGAFDMQDALNMMINNGKIVPKIKDISKKDIFSNPKMPRNEKDFNEFIKYAFMVNLKEVLQLLAEHPELADDEVNSIGMEILSSEEKTMKLADDIRKYCQYHAKQEREAYTTESEVAKAAIGTNQMLNVDVFPMYYEMLDKALNEPFTKQKSA